MSAPEAVLRKPLTEPLARSQNVPMDVTPFAVEDFEHHIGYSFATAFKARYLSAWGFPWWLADEESAPVSGAFSTAFSSAFDGGVDSPQGAAFSTAFSTAFS